MKVRWLFVTVYLSLKFRRSQDKYSPERAEYSFILIKFKLVENISFYKLGLLMQVFHSFIQSIKNVPIHDVPFGVRVEMGI